MKKEPLPPIQSELGHLLRGVARELRATRLHKRGLRRWAAVAVVAFGVLEWRAQSPAFAPYSLYVLGVLLAVAVLRSLMVARADKLDYAEAARTVEDFYPDLKQALRTAAEQQPGDNGRFNFLQLRVISSALKHANFHDWKRQPQNRSRWSFAVHAAMFATALVLTLGPSLLVLINRDFPVPLITLPKFGVSVDPGNAEVERGRPAVISATFESRIPRDASLIWRSPDGKTGTIPMARTLADPIFMAAIPSVRSDTIYSIRYSGNKFSSENNTGEYTLKVYDLPALSKADATLNYPVFTGLPQKVIPDTRRVSAITGTKLQYDFTMNKPMKDVTLTDDQGNSVPVTAANSERTKFTASLTIDQTEKLTMHLTDEADRSNPAPTDIRITALPLTRPVVSITFPVRDQRVSPIEEVHIQASARDQFGLLNYGLAYSVGAEEPQYLSLYALGNPAGTQASFNDVLKLESKDAQPGELVTWFAWADDAGPDGQIRRTTSDLAFAEVRPFESIFHEDPTGGGQQQPQPQQQQGNQSQNPVQSLLQLERQISVATWNLKSEDKPDATFKDDVGTLKESQDEAISQLADAAENATTATQRAAAAEAAKFMKQADDGFVAAGDKASLDPLTSAWSGAQGAYQALLKMQGREFNIAQTRQGQGQGQQRNTMQQQLDQLQFRQQQNRYQTENTAQNPQQQQQNQMQAQSRLNDLARRQQDLNQRLQEMQTALAAAQNQQQRDQAQQELQRLEEEQRNLLNDLDQARQNVDQLQANDQTTQLQQQMDQARQNMQQTQQQLAQNQVSQALASGTRADQALQQSQQTIRQQTANQFANDMNAARQAARDLVTQQQDDGRQLDQLAQNSARSLDTSAQRQALAQNFTQQAENLRKLTDQLTQIAQDSESTDPGLNKQLSDVLRQQAQANTTDDLKNGARLVNSGVLDQARPLQNDAARNLDQLRTGVERAAQSVLGDDTAALRYAQNELNDLTQQLLREQPANSEQFRNAAQSSTPGQGSAQANAGNPTGSSQNATGARGGQPGARGQGANGTNSQTAQNSNSFRNNGATQGQGNQPGDNQTAQNNPTGQPGQGNQPSQGRQGGQGQGNQPGSGQTAQNNPNSQPGQGNGARQGRGQGTQPGQGRQGGQGQGGQPGDQLAQNDQGNQGQGTQPGQGRQGGQGQGSQPGQGRQGGQGQPGGQLAQNGQGGQAGVADANGPDQIATDANAGQPGDQVATVDQADQPVDQPFDIGQPGAGGRAGRAGGRAGQRGGQVANGGGPRVGLDANGGNAGGAGATLLSNQYGGYGGGADPLIANYVPGPLTGNSTFTDWADRLRTVQNLLDDPAQRQQLADALAQAQDLRSNYIRHSQLPQWDLVMNNIVSPLTKVTTQLHQELTRVEQPGALQPVDQDPVPDKYANSVKRYYEALGN